MCGAIVTSPFDVVKTRLQSSLFHQKHAAVGISMGANGAGSVIMGAPRSFGILYNFVETGYIIRCVPFHSQMRITVDISFQSNIYREESFRALFKGLGPTLVGVIPASSIKFFVYGNGKRLIAEHFNSGAENSWVHLSAAALSGIATGTATNPIWVVKTRLQLDVSARSEKDRSRRRVFGGSWNCIKRIMREEGVRGFYKGLSASYLGVTEGTIQWVLYERLMKLNLEAQSQGGAIGQWAGTLGSAGMAKMIASLLTYPHEVSILFLIFMLIGRKLTHRLYRF